jgi:hypothetical protein
MTAEGEDMGRVLAPARLDDREDAILEPRGVDLGNERALTDRLSGD